MMREPRPPRADPTWSASQLRRWARDELADELDKIAATELRTAEHLRRSGRDGGARGYQARSDAAAELAASIRAEPAWWSPAAAGDDESECS